MKRVFIGLFKVLLVLFIVVILFLVFLLVAVRMMKPAQLLPNEGIWFCEELQIQLCFDDDPKYYDTHIVIDGEKYRCGVLYNDGNPTFSVMESDYLNPISIDDFVFEGECIYFDEQEMITEELGSRKEYIFKRVTYEKTWDDPLP